MVLEVNANKHYNRVKKTRGETLFDEDEQNRIREFVLDGFNDEFTEAQLWHLRWLFGRNDIYKDSSKVKILGYVKHLDLGFNMDEVKDIVVEARGIRNKVLYHVEEDG